MSDIIFSGPNIGDYEAFSNFEPCEITLDGITYPTTEHAYQAHKSRKKEFRLRISNIGHPSKAKKAGRALSVIRKDWQKVKFQVMIDCLRLKFAQEPFHSLLLSTGNRWIAEDARQWDDTEWGLGIKGNGKNKLGKAIMIVRAELRGSPSLIACAVMSGEEMVTGLSYPDCLLKIWAKNDEAECGSEGFMTNEGKFVSKDEGYEIVVGSGQLACGLIGDVLTGEDLF